LKRAGVSLVELLVVLAIIGVLLALLVPAVQSARERARETVCKNNLHQQNLAIAGYISIHKKLPRSNPPDLIGGWAIDILPFMEQKPLHDRVPIGSRIADAEDFLLRSPRLYRCPVRESMRPMADDRMNSAHYVLVPLSQRASFMLFEAAIDLDVPWASGAERSHAQAIKAEGPHHGGIFFTNGLHQAVEFMVQGQTQSP
jgi:prepilin-type N-terminal cleavage/methylation domain-containing protein